MDSKHIKPKRVAFAAVTAAIYFVISLLLVLPVTREFGSVLLKENGPVELASFAMMTLAGVLGLDLARRVRARISRLNLVALVLCGLGFFVIGMEEISWGQQFFGFQTPESIARTNMQQEMTWHNHQFFQNHLEVFAVMFALTGIAGTVLHRIGVNRQLMPQPILFFWLVPLLVVAGLDLMHDFWTPWHAFDELINSLDEVNEMHCALFALAFVLFKMRAFRQSNQ